MRRRMGLHAQRALYNHLGRELHKDAELRAKAVPAALPREGPGRNRPVTTKVRILLTRGTEWGPPPDFASLRNWRALEMAEEPHLCTCRRRAVLSACLTPHEAARVAFRRFPGAELYMWDEPNWIPGNTSNHKALRVMPAPVREVSHA